MCHHSGEDPWMLVPRTGHLLLILMAKHIIHAHALNMSLVQKLYCICVHSGLMENVFNLPLHVHMFNWPSIQADSSLPARGKIPSPFLSGC